jgi:SnoaL-like domain
MNSGGIERALTFVLIASLSMQARAASLDLRPVVPSGERALAMWQVQNLMSRHAYFHAAGQNLESVDALWVARRGPYAATATFGSPGWVMNGIETVRAAYGEENQRNRERALQALSAVDSKVANTRTNLGAGHEWVMHTSTTPLIEVSGDGRTAKGVWYSPGVGLMAKVVKDRIGIDGRLFYEKYAGDFILESGSWKIWHLQMAYDFVPGLPDQMMTAIRAALGEQSWAASAGEGREAGERPGFSMPPGFTKPLYSYPEYSPQRPGLLWPPLPEPYYTFRDTFSYCNCAQNTAALLNPDMTNLAREVDANADLKLTRAEWQTRKLPASAYEMFDKGRGYVTLEDFRNAPAPPGIDANGDGVLTIAEFRAFDRRPPVPAAQTPVP